MGSRDIRRARYRARRRVGRNFRIIVLLLPRAVGRRSLTCVQTRRKVPPRPAVVGVWRTHVCAVFAARRGARPHDARRAGRRRGARAPGHADLPQPFLLVRGARRGPGFAHDAGREGFADGLEPGARHPPARHPGLRLVERGPARGVATADGPVGQRDDAVQHHLVPDRPLARCQLGPRPDVPRGQCDLRRGARGGAQQQPRPRLLLTHHQPRARPALGAQRRGLQRGPAAHRRDRGAVRQRHGGQGPQRQPAARRRRLPEDHHHAEALRRQQQRDQPPHGLGGHGRPHPARVLHGPVPPRRAADPPRLDHVVLQLGQRDAGGGQRPPDGSAHAPDLSGSPATSPRTATPSSRWSAAITGSRRT